MKTPVKTGEKKPWSVKTLWKNENNSEKTIKHIERRKTCKKLGKTKKQCHAQICSLFSRSFLAARTYFSRRFHNTIWLAKSAFSRHVLAGKIFFHGVYFPSLCSSFHGLSPLLPFSLPSLPLPALSSHPLPSSPLSPRLPLPFPPPSPPFSVLPPPSFSTLPGWGKVGEVGKERGRGMERGERGRGRKKAKRQRQGEEGGRGEWGKGGRRRKRGRGEKEEKIVTKWGYKKKTWFLCFFTMFSLWEWAVLINM